ncbi:MAG: 16S rRNA (uracil(1498)-N(3))-methyltransferase [Acidobacteriota bacterium]
MAHRFFAPPAHISTADITLDSDEATHLTRVLRLGVGARVRVFDGAGHEYECQVLTVARGRVNLSILREIVDTVEAPIHVTLAQALIKSDKFDWVTQKAAELGVARIVPLTTKYSERLRSEEHWEKRQRRWDRISLEALKQCGRRNLVEIMQPMNWEEYCQFESSQLKVVLSEREGRTLASVAETAAQIETVSLAVGPEGGWDKGELATAQAGGFIPVHLGPRILRTETAAIAGISLVQFLFGDLGSQGRTLPQ